MSHFFLLSTQELVLILSSLQYFASARAGQGSGPAQAFLVDSILDVVSSVSEPGFFSSPCIHALPSLWVWPWSVGS